MPVYTVIICDYYEEYDNQEIEVEADNVEEAKEIGYEEWLNGVKERTYAEVIDSEGEE